MTERQFFEQWNRIYAAGDIDIPERVDWREVRYMLEYYKRNEVQEFIGDQVNRPMAFVRWCAENYWAFNADFWKAQTEMLEKLASIAATKPIKG